MSRDPASSSSLTRRGLLAGSAAALVLPYSAHARLAADDAAIRPFTVSMPSAALHDLRRRLAATRWPDRETVEDDLQGPQLDKVQELVRYWGMGYDWRKAEAKLNAHPQFITKIDAVDIHFIHVRSRHPNAMPLIVAHG